jgi:tRNA G18 (ribose-2'-O)-methylase SpoU
MERRPLPQVADLLDSAALVLLLVDLVDHTNVGAVFRNAAALGADAVLVTPGCADPLYRRAVKVSMGAVLALPWARTGPDPLGDLAAIDGLTTVGLTPAADAVDLADVALTGPRALLLGTEGDGLPEALQGRCDVRARIPMAGGIDSLNVAAASAIALHALRAATPGG